ncbi:MAG: hypothetical protein K9M81_02235 [Chthoniobacterales bacterium]|nr:hypothetical protein [Chthoniobacterales bacterium]
MKQHTDHKLQDPLAEDESSSLRSRGPFPWGRFWMAAGLLILFVAALILVIRWNPEPMTDDEERALLRVKNLAALNKANDELLNTYGWVDQNQGVLHIPLERAMELEINNLNTPARKPHAAYPIAPIDLVPVAAGMPTPAPTQKK